MTDEMNWRRLYDIYDAARQSADNKGINNSWESGWKAVEARVRELLTKPVASKKAVEAWVNTKWNPNNLKSENILAALSHFAPPAAPLPPICGMSVEEIEREVFRMIADRIFPIMEVDKFVIKEAALVAHRLAQPVPEADPDARAKSLFWKFMQGHGGFLPGTTDSHWQQLDEEDRDGWRAVAAMKKSDAQ